jgi:amino acid permease
MYGAGMLGIPYSYAKAGLIPSIIMHGFMTLVTWYSLYFLCYASEES